MNWRQIALKHCSVVRSSNVDKTTHEGEVPVRLINYTDVYYGDRLRPTDDLMEATASLQQVRQFRLQHGDVIITKDSETPEDIGMPAFVEEGADSLVCKGRGDLCCASCAAAASLWRWVVRRRDLKVTRAISGTLAI